jgi:hypothetical protein
MGHSTFQVGDLSAVIGDNAAHEKHRAGYNGLWSLRHRASQRSLFVPGIAGLNYEHIFNGDPVGPREVFFEPRNAPMTFRKISDSEAELHQPATPTFQLESWTRFKLVAPHYIDMSFRCVPRQHVFPRGWIGLFWASYINAPLDKSIYFPGGDEARSERKYWTQFCTQRHNDESTVLHRDDKTELDFAPDERETLYRNFSPFRYDLPVYYGNFEEHTWALMFDRTEGIRFSHSPSGGGLNSTHATTNPAWDFQFIIPDYEVNQEYGFKARAVFRPKCDREGVIKEFEDWKP